MDKPQFVYVTYIATTPEKVWAALQDPEMTKQYWGVGRAYEETYSLMPTPSAWITGPPDSMWIITTAPYRVQTYLECWLFSGFTIYALMFASVASLFFYKKDERPVERAIVAAAMLTVFVWVLLTMTPQEIIEEYTGRWSIETTFEEARAYAKGRQAGGKNGLPEENPVPAWEAMLPYVRSRLPVMVHADDVRQINAAVQWAATNSYKIILAGGRDAWKVADMLATNNIPVIFERLYNQGNGLAATPARDTYPYDVYFRAPELLRRAGVKVIFSLGLGGDRASETRNLPYSAAQAVAFGLPAGIVLTSL